MSRPPFWTAPIGSYAEYAAFTETFVSEIARRSGIEKMLTPWEKSPFSLSGFCGACQRATQFSGTFEHVVDQPGISPVPVWRETLNCTHCSFNNRMRAAIQFLRDRGQAKPGDSIYMTEQVTPLFKYLQNIHSNIVGSEFLSGGMIPGSTNKSGVRFEDITQLSFADDSFDHILSFDVLEHVPDYRRALSEFARCLRPGGKLLLSAPFMLAGPTTETRARIDDAGQIVHLLPPEYHGDPLSDGVLCFYHFGWDLLDDMKNAGLKNAHVHLFWSVELGYIGGFQYLLLAEAQ